MTEHAARSKSKKIHALLRELSDDEDNLVNVELESLDVPSDPQRPWLNDYRAYMDFAEQVPDGWTPVQWWGVSRLIRSIWVGLMYFSSTTRSAITLRGEAWHVITMRSWHHLYRASARSHRAASQSRNCAVVSRATLSRPYNV